MYQPRRNYGGPGRGGSGRYYGRRRVYPSRAAVAPTYPQIFSKVVKDVSYLKGLINTEFKFRTLSFSTTMDTTGSVHHLNNISQGDGGSTRDGDQVRVKGVRVRGIYTIHASATTTVLRCIAFVWKNVNNIAPVKTDIVDAGVNSMRELDERRNVRILWDKTFVLDSVQRPLLQFEKYFPLDIKTLFTRGETSGGSAQTEQNGVYMLVFSDQATNVPSENVDTRCTFVDN